MDWVGVDVGGTFTDIVAYDEATGALAFAKTPTGPADPTVGLLSAFAKLEVALSGTGRVVHGTTIGTNAILERTGAPVWMVTTQGFRDTLEIARTNRTVLYDIRGRKPAPLVERHRIVEVDERVAFDGTVMRPLRDEDDGTSAWGNIDFGNVRTIQSAEALESGMPLVVERSELRPDSGGEGTTRGALGLRRELRLLDGEARYSVLSDRAVIPPFGVGGAGAAAPVGVSVRRDGEDVPFPTPGKVTGHAIAAGDVVVMQSAGGGFGDPLARDPERVRRDVRAGYVSPERARHGYGVVLTAAATWT